MINKIKLLTKELNKASYEYYSKGTSNLTDEEFDYKLEELKNLEEKTHFKMSNSPVNKVGYNIITEQNKVKHKVPMLSLEKVHSAKEIIKFSEKQELIAMFKMDGISIRATYNNKGDIIGLCSRGNGTIGSDLFYQRFSFDNLPLHINVDKETIFDGEAIITDHDFESINCKLSDENKYSHSRNLAAGSLALLDTSISSKRHLKFIVWDVIEGCYSNEFSERLNFATEKGFDVVGHHIPLLDNFNEYEVDRINKELFSHAKNLGFRIDGIVWKYNSISYGKCKGRTEHHFCNAVAWKNENKVYKTVLEDIEWQVSKTGLINPVAIFKEINLDGASTTRATLHNLSYIKNLELGVGDIIGVIRSNEVIPKVVENYTRSNKYKSIQVCPICGGLTEVIKENDSEFLYCSNPDCSGKLLGKLTHAVSRDALNIDGLSEQTLEKFISLGWLNSIEDIYHLADYKDRMIHLDKFGKKSVDKLLANIEKSRETTLQKLLYSLSIPLIGKSASKAISKYCNGSYEVFTEHMALSRGKIFLEIDDFGDKMWEKLDEFWSKNCHFVTKMVKNELKVGDKTTQNESLISSDIFAGKTFVITGTLVKFKNRNELVAAIESRGGKVSGSVSAKTHFLVNNDIQSSSSKNQNARKLNIPIISEEDFIQMIS